MNQLTEQEVQQIELEAKFNYADSYSQSAYYHGATSERLKAKVLAEALEKVYKTNPDPVIKGIIAESLHQYNKTT